MDHLQDHLSEEAETGSERDNMESVIGTFSCVLFDNYHQQMFIIVPDFCSQDPGEPVAGTVCEKGHQSEI